MAESHREEIAKLEALYAGNPDGRVFTHLAEAYRKAGDLDRAREILDQGLRRHADYASAHVVLGRVLADMGQPDAAASSFERVLQLDPENLIARRSLAESERQGGRHAEALGHFRELLARNPNDEDLQAAVSELETRITPSAGAAPQADAAPSFEPDQRADADVPETTSAAADAPLGPIADFSLDWAPPAATGPLPDTNDLASFFGGATPASEQTMGQETLEDAAHGALPIDDASALNLDPGPVLDEPRAAEEEEAIGFDPALAPGDLPLDLTGFGSPGETAGAPDQIADEPTPAWAEAWGESEDATTSEADEAPPITEPGAVVGLDEETGRPVGLGLPDEPTSDGAEAEASPEGDGEGDAPELARTEIEPPSAETVPAAPAPALPGGEMATETLAQLYRRQGLPDRAAAVYRALLASRPDDERLAAALAEVEGEAAALGQSGAEEGWLETVESAWTGGAGAAGTGGDGLYAWSEQDAEEASVGPSIADHFAALLSWRPSSATVSARAEPAPAEAPELEEAQPWDYAPAAAIEPGSEEAPQAEVEPTAEITLDEFAYEAEAADEGAVLLLGSEDFADPTDEAVIDAEAAAEPELFLSELAEEDESPALEATEGSPWGEPAPVPPAPAQLEQSAAAPARAPSSGDNVSDAFDEWFGSDAGEVPAAGAPSAAALSSDSLDEGGEDDDDLEMFRSWLQSLKK